jgi:phospholipid/cholesterol/gamma-HCH transport system substrate-binding protein
MAGVRIGSVDEITLPINPRETGIRVGIGIDSAYAARVREGTTAALTIAQVVANEKVVSLAPGDPQRAALPPGSVIPARGGAELLETGRNIAETVQEITVDLKEILGAIRRGDGLLGKAIVDPTFSEVTMDRLTDAVSASARVLERIDRGEGLVGRMLADSAYGDKVAADVGRASAALAATATRIENGQGLIGQLTTPGTGDDLLADVSGTADSLRAVADGMRRGDGLGGLLAGDSERGRRIADDLERAAANFASITQKIESGQGTLGLLVNDRGLYDGAENVITGAKKSKLVSWLMRRLHDSGAEEREKSHKTETGKIGSDDGYSGETGLAGEPGAGAGEHAGPERAAGRAPAGVSGQRAPAGVPERQTPEGAPPDVATSGRAAASDQEITP